MRCVRTLVVLYMARSEIGSAYVSAVSFVKQVVMVAPADSRRACPRGPAGGGRSCAPKKVFEVIVKCAKTAEDVAGRWAERKIGSTKATCCCEHKS